jgi:hypothetical protein
LYNNFVLTVFYVGFKYFHLNHKNVFSSESIKQISSVIQFFVDIYFALKEKILPSCLMVMVYKSRISTKLLLTMKVLGSCIYFGSIFLILWLVCNLDTFLNFYRSDGELVLCILMRRLKVCGDVFLFINFCLPPLFIRKH